MLVFFPQENNIKIKLQSSKGYLLKHNLCEAHLVGLCYQKEKSSRWQHNNRETSEIC